MLKLLQMIVLIFIAFVFTAKSVTISDSVLLGQGYKNEVWYNINTGFVKESDNTNWDIAFENGGMEGGIHANGAKGIRVWVVPNKTVEDFKSFSAKDTVGMAGSWEYSLNSEDTWSVGAFNLGKNGFDTDGDYGWGAYDMGTHYIVGDKIFVVKLNNTTYKKFYVESLAAGEYSFVYSNLDGTEESLGKVSKKSSAGRNFGYFSLGKAEFIDREPISADWHIAFGKYEVNYPNGEGGFMPYPVTGVRSNKGVRVAKVTGVAPETAAPIEWVEDNYLTKITTIGADWKTFNMATNTYDLKQDWVYFLSDDAIENLKPQIYRLYFTGFTGTSNGLIKFQKEALPVSVIEKDGYKIADFAVYPSIINSGDNLNIAINNFSSLSNAKIEILNLEGIVLESFNAQLSNTLLALETGKLNLSAGMYFVKVTIDNKSGIEKLIVK